MMKKITRVVKNGLRKAVEHRRMLACAFTYGMMQANMVICHAATAKPKATTAPADVADVTSGLDSIKAIVLAIIGSIGVIYLAKSVLEFASAYQQSDSSGMNNALKGIAGGLMMAGISTIIGILV